MRLLSLALNVPGPVAVARLVAEGATAVKVEPPAGDPLATLAPAWFAELHDGVTRETLDLKTAAGRQAVDRLLARPTSSSRASGRRRSNGWAWAATGWRRRPRPFGRCRIVGDADAPERPATT